MEKRYDVAKDGGSHSGLYSRPTDVTKGHCDCDAHGSSVKWIRLIMMSCESMG